MYGLSNVIKTLKIIFVEMILLERNYSLKCESLTHSFNKCDIVRWGAMFLTLFWELEIQ